MTNGQLSHVTTTYHFTILKNSNMKNRWELRVTITIMMGGEKSFNEIIGTNVRAIIMRSIFMLAKEK